MPRKIEKNAKSKEEALRLAAEEFGVTVGELSYTVEREIGKGILGRLLGREVIISAWITKEAEEEERLRQNREQRRRARESREAAKPRVRTEPQAKPAAAKNIEEKNIEVKNSEVKNTEAKPAEPKRPERTRVEKSGGADAGAKPYPEKQPEKNAGAPAREPRNRKPTEKSVADAKYFAENVIHMMGLPDAEITAENGGDAVNVTVSGERMGLLIGKRGDTLDAVQYLTSLYVNREKNSYIKVNIDTEGYRAKREEVLVKLARNLERRVVRDGEPVTLEPMSPNERRIIHAALQHSTDVKTYSVGDEPSRRVVVAPAEQSSEL